MWAELIVVDLDLFKVSTYEIYKTGVVQSGVGGKQVYQK